MKLRSDASSRKILKIIFDIMAVFSFCIMAFTSFSMLGFSMEITIVEGLSFIPPFVVTALGIATALGFFLSRRSKLGVCFIAFSLVIFAAFADYSLKSFFHTPPRNEKTQLRAAALNLQYFTNGPENIAEFLKSLGAEIFLLSEAEGDFRLKKRFARALKPYTVLYPQSGDTAIATSYPILSFEEVELPSFQPSLSGFNSIPEQKNHPRRTFVHALIDASGIPMHVLSLRLIAGRGLSHAPLDQLTWGLYILKEQRREVQAFIRYLEALKGPILFGGDLNATPASSSIQALNQIAEDAYLNIHSFGALTFKTKLFPWQKKKNLPALRLDYFFTRNGLLPLQIEVVKTEVSDHFALRGEFFVKPEKEMEEIRQN